MNIKKIVSGNIQQLGMVLALLILVIVFTILTGGALIRPMNISNIFVQNSFELILALGSFFSLLALGDTDLSVGSIMGLAGGVFAILYVQKGWGTLPSVLVALLVSMAFGLVQGYFIAYQNISSFIATLAGSLAGRGLTMYLMNGQTLGPFDTKFQFIANGFVLPKVKIFGLNVFALVVFVVGAAAVAYSELNRRKKRQQHGFSVSPMHLVVMKIAALWFVMGFVLKGFSDYNGVPFVLVIVAVLAILYSFVAGNTVLGRRAYMMGGNQKAAELSGVRVREMKFLVFINSAFLAAIAGLVFAARLNAATPRSGTGYEMDAIISCTLGGVSGARGTVMGVLVGAAILAVLNNGMTIIGIGTDMQQVIKGCILLLTVALDIKMKSKSSNE